jgi:hypothetical protein
MACYTPLRFLRAGEVPRRAGDAVFRSARLANGLVFAISLSVTLALLASPLFFPAIPDLRGMPSFIPYIAALFTGFFAYIGWRAFRAGLRSSNWILRAASEGLYVKFRSYMNDTLSQDDPVVVFIPKAEVRALRAHREKTRRPDSGDGGSGEIVVPRRYLEIELRDPADISEVAEHLARERARREPGFAGTKMKLNHYPVRTLPQGVVRIDWAGPDASVRPRLPRVLKILGWHYQVTTPADSTQRSAAELGPEEQEDRLIEMVECGEMIAAVKLARQLYGYDMTEAVEFVETLRAG